MPLSATVECKTCNKVTHTFNYADTTRENVAELLQKLTVGILSNHVQTPCSGNHELVPSELPADALWGQQKPLKIECLHPTCAQKATRTFEKVVPVELISLCSLQFHAIHEGHPIQVQWGDSFIVRTP